MLNRARRKAKKAKPQARMEPLEAVEFELALDLQDPATTPFEECVKNAAAAASGELLFDMPSEGTLEDASRISAVRIRDAAREHIVFAVLDGTGSAIRVASGDEIGERYYGFAKAFVGVLERLRGDESFRLMPAEGTA